MRYWLLLLLALPGWALATVTGGTVLTSTTATTKTLTCPAAASGNARIVFTQSDGGGAHVAPSAGSGTWTQIATNGLSMGVYAQIATGSDTNPSLVISTTTAQIAQCLIVTGVDTTSIPAILDVSATGNLSSQTLLRYGAVTPTANNEVVMYFGKSNNAWTSIAPPSGATETADTTVASLGFTSGYQIQTTATAVAQADVVITGNTSNSTQTSIRIVLKATGSTAPTITSVSTDNVLTSTETNLHVIGTGFGASQGTGTVKCVDGSVTSTFSVDSWSDTDIQVDAVQGNCRFGSRSIQVIIDAAAGTTTKAVTINAPTNECYYDLGTLITYSESSGHSNRFGGLSADLTDNAQLHIRNITRSSGSGCTDFTVRTNGTFKFPVAVTAYSYRWHNGTAWQTSTPSMVGQNKLKISAVNGYRDSCPECIPTAPEEIPDATHSVCSSGCTYTIAQLQTTAISARSAGDVLELRTMTPGATEEWATRIDCSGKSGTAGNEIIVRVRQGDHVRLSMTTVPPVALLHLSNCHYFYFDGGLAGGGGLELANPAFFSPSCARNGQAAIFNCYPNGKTILTENGTTHVAFYRMTVHGAGTGSGLFPNDFNSDTGYFLFKDFHGSLHGGNQGVNPDGTWQRDDSGDLIWMAAHHSVIVDSVFSKSGHKLVAIEGPWVKVQGSSFTNWWGDYAVIPPRSPSAQGNHTLELSSGNRAQLHGTRAFPNAYGPILAENNEMVDSGADGERLTWNYSHEIQGIGIIVRGNYYYNINVTPIESSLSSTCGGNPDAPSGLLPWVLGENKIYQNTIHGHAGIFIVDQDTAFPVTADPRNCSGIVLRNNVFAEMLDGRSKDNTTQPWLKRSMTKLAKGGYLNDWRDSSFDNNIFGGPGTHPQASLAGLGGGTVSLSDNIKWPLNLHDNTIATVRFVNGLTTPTKSKAGLALAANSAVGLGDAAPLTHVTAPGTGTTFTVADPYIVADDFDMGGYTWRGLYRSYGDCICVGAAANSTVNNCVVTRIADSGNPRTGPITTTGVVTRVANSPIWKATNNTDGSCGTVWKNRGAVQ